MKVNPVNTNMDTLRVSHIGSLNEKNLNASLRDWYGRPGNLFEGPVDDFVVDIPWNDLLI